MVDRLDMLLRGLRIDWEEVDEGSYLRGIPAIAGLRELDFTEGVTFFVGENGSGKSTLLEAIAVSYGFNPEGGTRNYRFSTYDSHSELCRAMTLVKGAGKPGWGYFLRAESFYNVATAEDAYSRDIGGQPQHFHERSHGESFLALGGQFIIVTHSPILMGIPDATILSFDGGPVHPISYQETDSYQITKLFLENREQMIKRLSEDLSEE